MKLRLELKKFCINCLMEIIWFSYFEMHSPALENILIILSIISTVWIKSCLSLKWIKKPLSKLTSAYKKGVQQGPKITILAFETQKQGFVTHYAY